MAPIRLSLTVLVALVLLMALTALVAGCDPQRVEKLEEGVSTEVEVRKQFGDPVTITTEADGSRSFDYPRQPEGWTNYVITIAPDGRMSSLRQLLNEDNFARVKPGLTQQQVRKLLGRPAKTQRFALRIEEVWDWRFKQNGHDAKMFSVTFGADGAVLGSAVGEDARETMTGGK
jgi:outer membrane protein assembly factor BamE (lipoprotein component of BamABCDE complex)